MNLDDIKELLELIRVHELTELELEQDGVKIRIKKDAGSVSSGVTTVAPREAPGVASAPTAPPAPVTLTAVAAEPVDEVELAVIKSPIVGTFFRSSEPGASPFVEVGQRVKKGQTLCIIEAMKLMNEIDSEYEGELVKVYVENGQPVQYGERLFAIRVA